MGHYDKSGLDGWLISQLVPKDSLCALRSRNFAAVNSGAQSGNRWSSHQVISTKTIYRSHTIRSPKAAFTLAVLLPD